MRANTILLLAFGLSLNARAADPLTLSDALESARARHPALAAARAARDAAQAGTGLARANQLGRLETSFQWTPVLKNPQIAVPANPPFLPAQSFPLDLTYRQQGSITLDQPLWTWGSLSGRVKAARLQEEEATQALRREGQEVRYQVIQAYLKAREAEAASEVAASTLELERAFLATAQARVREGTAPRLDSLKAELAVSRAGSDLVAQQNGARAAREELVAATEDPRFREGALAPVPPAQGPDRKVEDLVARALADRGDLRSLERRREALGAAADATRSGGRPTLSLVGSVAQQNGAWGPFLQDSSRTYLLGLALRWDALGQRRARYQAAETRMEADQVQAQARALADQATLEVRTAWLQVEDARAQVRLAEAAMAQAEEQARVARISYREGVATAVEAQDAELDLSRARYQQLAADLARDLAEARLEWAAGS